jgi:hypothetical protein
MIKTMKVKALRNKTTGKYLHFKHDEYDAMVVERSLPELLEADITLETLLDHYDSTYPHIDTSEFEVVELDIVESGVVGADIRNKLSPIKNLLAVIGIYFIEKSSGKKILLKGIINKDIKQSRISIEYLTKMFN